MTADISDKDLEKVARAIYAAAYIPGTPTPCPGWSWEKAGPVQQAFAMKQARAALTAVGYKSRPTETPEEARERRAHAENQTLQMMAEYRQRQKQMKPEIKPPFSRGNE